MFFRAAAEIAQVRPIIVNGDPAVLTKLVAAGEIGALWQGAVVPIPSLTEVANLSDAVIFGLSDAEVAAMLKRPDGRNQKCVGVEFRGRQQRSCERDRVRDHQGNFIGGRSDIRDSSRGRRHARRQCGIQQDHAVPSRRDAIPCRSRDQAPLAVKLEEATPYAFPTAKNRIRAGCTRAGK